MSYTRFVIVAAGVLLFAQSASAQVIGTFRWNTAPYCNVMNITVTQVGGFYRLEGYDEQCGGNPRQPLWGIAVVQANGSITFGLTQVMLPGSVKAVAIRASIALSTLGGTWADNAGSSGDFVFNPPTVSGGPRTVPVVFDTIDGAAPGTAASDPTVAELKAEIEALKAAMAALALKQEED